MVAGERWTSATLLELLKQRTSNAERRRPRSSASARSSSGAICRCRYTYVALPRYETGKAAAEGLTLVDGEVPRDMIMRLPVKRDHRQRERMIIGGRARLLPGRAGVPARHFANRKRHVCGEENGGRGHYRLPRQQGYIRPAR